MTPEQFLLFAEPLPEPMILVSGDGLVLAGNRAVEERLGIGLQGFRGRRLADVAADPPDEVAHYLRLCARSRKLLLGALTFHRNGDGIACRTEGSVVRPKADGAEAILMLRLIPKESAVGQFVALNQRIEELGREVQRRKQAEEEARQQGERFRITLQSIGDAVIVTDPKGRVQLMNRIAESSTGWGHDEAAGHPLERVFNIVEENTRLPIENPAMRALREGTVVGLANHTLLVAKDGTERPIDDSAAPIRDGQGDVVGAVLVFHDITPRKRAEALVREREQLFRTLAESIPQLAWTARPDGYIFWYNRRWYEYTGTTPEQMEGWGWQSVHDPDVLPKVLERWKASIATGEPFDMVFPLKGADGQFRPFLTRVVPLRDDSGHVLQWFGTNTDISEQQAMEEALREEDRRKTEFLALLAHELRNPLAPLRNGLQVIRLAGQDQKAVDQARELMERQLQHLVRLVDDLLDLSRISRGKIELRKERVALAALVASALEMCEPVVRQHGQEVSMTLPDESVYLDADKTRLAQALCNLLTNAAKFSDRGSRILLTAKREGSEAIIGVQDTGIGIPADKLSSIFEMFTQVDRSLEKSHGGLGIGLSIVKRLIELHGGTVEARSEGYGMGSEFIVHLPAVLSVVHEQGDAVGNDPQPTARHRILVVDDNVDAAGSLAMMLRLMGNEVRTAHDGLEGVETAAAFRPDMILLDIGMPKLNGFDACRRIREQPWGKNIVIVALTGWGQSEDRRRSQEVGFDHHLVKPAEPAALEKLLAVLRPSPT